MQLALLALILGQITPSTSAVELNRLAITYQYFHPSGRDPFLFNPNMKLKEGLTLTFNADLGVGFYWDNDISAVTDSGQYRTVQWAFRLGIHVWPSLSLQYSHQSRHLLDEKFPENQYPGKFPVQDSLGLTWTIYGGSGRPSLLNSPKSQLR